MAFYELYPFTPDDEHPAIVEHHILTDKNGAVLSDTTVVISQTGNEVDRINSREALGFYDERSGGAVSPDIGRLMLSGATQFE